MQHIDVLLIDRSNLLRAGVKRLLEKTEFRICGEAFSVEEGIRLVGAGLRPKIVLLDYPAGAQAFEQMQSLHSSEAKPKLVVLSSQMNLQWLATSLAAGADGYLVTNISPDALIQSMHLIVLGEKVLPTDLARLLGSAQLHIDTVLAAAPPALGLSSRETEILHFLPRGYSNKLSARQLNITEGTVKVHLKEVLKKLKVTNRTQAAIWAFQRGIGNQPGRASAGSLTMAVSRPTPTPSSELSSLSQNTIDNATSVGHRSLRGIRRGSRHPLRSTGESRA